MENSNNKFYDLYINNKVDDSILDVKMGGATFEDHFWHLACLALYYENKKDEYIEKYCLSTLCNLNYVYSAMLYFNKYEVLPSTYKSYIKPFVNTMKNDKTEARIAFYNKKDKNGNVKSAMRYSLMTLITIPIMLFLIFVCKVDTTIAMIVSIIAVFVLELFVNPITRNRSIKKKNENRVFDKRLANYLSYYDRFAKLLQNDLYMDLIKARKEDKIQEIVNKLKKGLK